MFERFGRALLIVGMVTVAGCAGARRSQKPASDDDFLAMFPAVTFSSHLVHSPSGDMSARLPQGWILLDASRLGSPEVFAMACDSDYTMSVIFSEVTVDELAREGYNRAGLHGLGEASFTRRTRRNPKASLVGTIEEFAIGRHLFSGYTYTTDSSKTLTRTAVFYTSSKLYECSVTELDFTEHPVPSARTLTDVHQLILGTIEW